MIPLAGYADRLSVRPGETIAFKVANATGQTVKAEVVRVISADPNPNGPKIQTEAVAATIAMCTEPAAWPVNGGSYGIADLTKIAKKGADLTALGDSFTCLATIWPTLKTPGRSQTIMAREDSFNLALDPEGRLNAQVTTSDGASHTVIVKRPIHLNQWAMVWLAYNTDSKTVSLGWSGAGTPPQLHETTINLATSTLAISNAPLLIAAQATGEAISNHFNGRIERPILSGRTLTTLEIQAAATGATVPDLIAEWDFSQAMETSRIIDIGPNACHGSLINAPTRAMRGASWSGREMCWRHAPKEYAAIHFHDDDLDDCRWPTAFEWTVPEATKSAQYALLLSAGTATENIPFFIVPPKGRSTARIAVLISTFTYTIYGNHARPEWQIDPDWQQAWREQTQAWGAYPHNPGDHPEYGWSTYNTHSDGSGIAIASWHRPMFNVRLGYLTYPDPDIRASGLRHYPADTHLTAWLEAKGYDYDIITDWELQTEGSDVLKSYDVVTTGSHPEYHTRETLDALLGYRDGGGRFMYLGGNGFYWKVALSGEQDGVIEIRRAEGGIRAWAAEPGEYYNQFDGEYGGLWRRNGRPPQELTGVGFTAQGNFVGSHYRIHDAARTSRAAWILDGLEEQTLGAHGLSGHGAAGFELDRTDKHLGTPAHAIILASSEGHEPDAPWIIVPEERLTHITTVSGESVPDLIRADIVFFETPNNGAVFSTGSITFCGSLPTNNFDNDASHLLKNVLDRFLDPNAIFEMPLS